MTAWRLLYENRFPRDANGVKTVADYYRAADGSQSVQPGPGNLGGFGIGLGRNVIYRPEVPLHDVIGIDVKMEFALFDFHTHGAPLPLFSIDVSGLSVILVETGPTTSLGEIVCRMTIRLDDAVTSIDGLRFAPPGPGFRPVNRLNVRWTTNGQLHIWFNGPLIAYENAIKPGYQFNLERLSIGDVDSPDVGTINGRVSAFRLVELREDNVVESLGEQLDPKYIPQVSERCEKSSQHTLSTLLRQTRDLMASFNASKTSNWRKEDGGDPFTPDAEALHKAGDQAGEAFARYVRDATLEARQDVVNNLKDLLTILAADQPELFKQLLADSRKARDALDEHCKEAVSAIRSANPEVFDKLDPLSSDLEEVLRSLEGDV